jgi:hypothetical protein
MNGPFKPADQRRIIAAARLLLSDKPGEVVAAVGAIGRLLPSGDSISSVIERGVSSALAPSPMPMRCPSGYPRPLNERANLKQEGLPSS